MKVGYRWRPAWWLGPVFIIALTITGCIPSDRQSAVYTVSAIDGGLDWIGEPAGVPIWSPTGDGVVWGNEDGLFLRSIDESEPTRLVSASVAGVPAWSPDGSRIAYIDRDRASLVVAAMPSGIEQFAQPLDRRRRVGARFPLLTLGGPSWSPDGSLIAFVCWDGAGDEVCIVRSDGTGWRQVTRLQTAEERAGSPTPGASRALSNAGPPVWAPRGALLAVAMYPERPGAPTGVFIVNPERGLTRRVSTLQPNSEIRWYPDGRSILFSAFFAGRSDTFRVVLPTRIQQRVTAALPDPSRNPSVSADGSRIAVESAGGIVVLGDRGAVRAFGVAGLRASHPSWSADGSLIAISAVGNPIVSYD